MKHSTLIVILALCTMLTPVFGQAHKADLDGSLQALKTSMEKRNFALLEPMLDQSYAVGDRTRPKADEIVPQLLAQGPGLVSFTVKSKDVKADKTTVEIEYEVEGHPIGTDKSTSRCVLTPGNKFVTIEYFDAMLARAKVVRKH